MLELSSPTRSCRPSSIMLFKVGLVDSRLTDASDWTPASASLTPNIAAAPNPTPRTFKRSRKAPREPFVVQFPLYFLGLMQFLPVTHCCLPWVPSHKDVAVGF